MANLQSLEIPYFIGNKKVSVYVMYGGNLTREKQISVLYDVGVAIYSVISVTIKRKGVKNNQPLYILIIRSERCVNKTLCSRSWEELV